MSRRRQEESAAIDHDGGAIERCRGDVAAEEGGFFAHRPQRAGRGGREGEWRPPPRRLLQRVGERRRQRFGVAVGVDRLQRQAAALIEQRNVARECRGDDLERGRRELARHDRDARLGAERDQLRRRAAPEVGERERAAVRHHATDLFEQRRFDRSVAAPPDHRRDGGGERGLSRRERRRERRREERLARRRLEDRRPAHGQRGEQRRERDPGEAPRQHDQMWGVARSLAIAAPVTPADTSRGRDRARRPEAITRRTSSAPKPSSSAARLASRQPCDSAALSRSAGSRPRRSGERRIAERGDGVEERGLESSGRRACRERRAAVAAESLGGAQDVAALGWPIPGGGGGASLIVGRSGPARAPRR